MNQLSEEGHVYYPYDLLVERCQQILEVERDVIIKAFGIVVSEKKLVVEDLNRDLDQFEPNKKAVYLTKFYVSESGVAKNLSLILRSRKSIRDIDIEKALQRVQKKIKIKE